MKNYRNILVVIDPYSDEQKALQRAIELANKLVASQKVLSEEIALTAFCSIYDFSYDMTTFLSTDEREIMRNAVIENQTKQLQNILTKYESQFTIHCEVTWHNRPFEAILEQVNQQRCDLVIKETHHHPKFKSLIFTPTDWHLIRKSSCPVLLVKDHKWPENGNVIAAVNVANDEPEHCQLNDKITTLSQDFATLMQGDVHLVNSYPGTPVNISIEIPEFNVTEYNNAMKAHHVNAMSEHANNHHIKLENTLVLEGLPEDVIKDVAESLDAELVVLGTIGRTGLSGALIGNTAEQVVDLLQCDILAVKPDGFDSE